MSTTTRRFGSSAFGLSRVGGGGAGTLIPLDMVSLSATSTPVNGQPGDTLTWEVTAHNTGTAAEIPTTDPHYCERGGQTGARIVVGGGLETGRQLQDESLCLPVGSSETISVDIPLPASPGDYNVVVSAVGPVDAPALFDSIDRTLIVREDAPPADGGDEVFGLPRDQALIGVGVLGLGLGAASLFV